MIPLVCVPFYPKAPNVTKKKKIKQTRTLKNKKIVEQNQRTNTHSIEKKKKRNQSTTTNSTVDKINASVMYDDQKNCHSTTDATICGDQKSTQKTTSVTTDGDDDDGCHKKDDTSNFYSHGDDHSSQNQPKLGCGVFGRYPLITLLVFVALGIGIGIGLAQWQPDDPETKAVALKWIGLFGDMFLRALKAIVLPIVFVNVIISMVDMVDVGAAGGVGGKTVGLYVATTLMAGIFGVCSCFVFVPLYTQGSFSEADPTYISLGCGTDSFLTQHADGTVTCAHHNSTDDVSDTLWVFDDVNSTLIKTAGESVEEISLSDSIYSGVFESIVTDNIFRELTDGNFAAVVIFATFMGVAVAKYMKKEKISKRDFVLMELLKSLDSILQIMILWVLLLIPFAVLSMISAAIGGQEDLADMGVNIGLVIAATWSAFILQFLFTYCIGYWLFTRKNPFLYMKHLLPTQLMAFSISSSAACIPVTEEAVRSTGLVPDAVINFVVPLGATVNMDGTAVYFLVASVWLAVYNGITPTVADYVLLFIVASVGSMGAAPVPNSGPALILTAYNTVFHTTGIPDGFSLIFSIDWLLDRSCTVLNVTGDSTVCGIVGQICSVEVDGDNQESASSDVENSDIVDTHQIINRFDTDETEIDDC
mmetsp:Transcript_17210/g.41800  ORF Transcript_17210/g.41800 Transcript_17210/m.41800 type:complete len:646 (+) Transcript_17210:159-2096(+)